MSTALKQSAPTAPVARVPKARVMFAQFPSLYMELAGYNVWGDGIPVLVQPFPTVADARRTAKWANLSYEEKVEEIAAELEPHLPSTTYGPWKTEYMRQEVRRGIARAVLALTGSSATNTGRKKPKS